MWRRILQWSAEYYRPVPMLNRFGSLWVEIRNPPAGGKYIVLAYYSIGWVQWIGFSAPEAEILVKALLEAARVANTSPVHLKQTLLEKILGYIRPEVKYKRLVPSQFKHSELYLKVEDNHMRNENAVVIHLVSSGPNIPRIYFAAGMAEELAVALEDAIKAMGDENGRN